jgi:hypothetical protein
MVYSAPRLSPVAAYGRCLLLYAAALSTPSACSREVVGEPPNGSKPYQYAALALGVHSAAA